jgi:hypothetical protein
MNAREGGNLGIEEESRLVYFNYEDLKGGTRGFNTGNKLGEGGFGQVYKVKL